MDRLTEIITHKYGEIKPLLSHKKELQTAALLRDDFRPFGLSLRRDDGRLALIAEVKKASPSAGVIEPNFNPVQIALAYQDAGASAVSVLTDEKFFQGSLDDLKQVRSALLAPVLRKDFIVDEVQIYEAVCAGADAILLIVAALDQDKLVRLHDIARAYQLDVLVEVHSLEEMDRALNAEAEIIGINNRNLATFTVDLETTEELSEEAPEDVILVSESGIKNGEDTRFLMDCGVDAILVGESLMRADDVHELIEELIFPEGDEEGGQGSEEGDDR